MDPATGNAGNPTSFHEYAYASLDPIQGTDPTGWETLGSVAIAGSISGTLSRLRAQAGMEVLDTVGVRCDTLVTGVLRGALMFSSASPRLALPRSARHE